LDYLLNEELDTRKKRVKQARDDANKNAELINTARSIEFLDPSIATGLIVQPGMMKKFRMDIESVSPICVIKEDTKVYVD